MAASDTSRMGDLIPWWFLGTPGCSNLTSPVPDDGAAGEGSLENLGGPLPWGCDQPAPAALDQA